MTRLLKWKARALTTECFSTIQKKTTMPAKSEWRNGKFECSRLSDRINWPRAFRAATLHPVWAAVAVLYKISMIRLTVVGRRLQAADSACIRLQPRMWLLAIIGVQPHVARRQPLTVHYYSAVSLSSFLKRWDGTVLRYDPQFGITVFPTFSTDLRHVTLLYNMRGRQRLRSSSSSSLIVSRTRLSTVGDRTFPVAAPRVWNSLPDLVTSAPSVAVFRSRLKTHLFNISYPSPLWLFSACAVTL